MNKPLMLKQSLPILVVGVLVLSGLVFAADISNYLPRENHPPSIPIITGPTHGRVGVEYEYTFNSTDDDGDYLCCLVDWDDGSPIEVVCPSFSNPEGNGVPKANHSWDTEGTYGIRAKARDEYGAESGWGYLEVTMPKNNILSEPSSNQQISQQYSSMPSSQEPKLQNKDLDSLLSPYGMDTENTVGEFEQLLHNLVSEESQKNPRLAAKLRNDIHELSDILEQIGVKDNMTIAEVLPVIENNKDLLQEKGINLFCSIDIYAIDGGCWPIFRLLIPIVLYGGWEIDWPELQSTFTNGKINRGQHIKINSTIVGLQYLEGRDCFGHHGRFIGMIGITLWHGPPLTCWAMDVKGIIALFSRSNVPFVNSTGGFQQSLCNQPNDNLVESILHEGVGGYVK